MKTSLILLAEDDDDMRSTLAGWLRREGHAVRECCDGRQLLEQLEWCESKGERLDLVVTDIQMPGATGFDVLDWLGERRSSIGVILITAFGDDRTRQRAERLGATSVLDKPFELAALCERVLAALEGEVNPGRG